MAYSDDDKVLISPKGWTAIGYNFGLGLLWLVLLWAVVSLGVGKVRDAFGWGEYDNTDARRGEHSGLRLRTDALTGCQYLQAGDALTPRLDASGRQICGPR